MKEKAMSNAIHVKDGTSALRVGVRVAAVAAVVGLITLVAGRGNVLPDELAAEQPAAFAAAPAWTRAQGQAPDASVALVRMSRDPSLPNEADVVPRAKDEAAAPTF
jgi:hypothetical protein